MQGLRPSGAGMGTDGRQHNGYLPLWGQGCLGLSWAGVSHVLEGNWQDAAAPSALSSGSGQGCGAQSGEPGPGRGTQTPRDSPRCGLREPGSTARGLQKMGQGLVG